MGSWWVRNWIATLGIVLSLGVVLIYFASEDDERRTTLRQPNGCVVVVERSDGGSWSVDRWEPCRG